MKEEGKCKMGYDWKTCPTDIKTFIEHLNKGIKEILTDNYVGFYIHGSLAMGGFHPKSSDIDVLVITNKPIENKDRTNLALLLLKHSNSPYPIEISFLNTAQLQHWQHPCPFDFHYSECWRERFEKDLMNGNFPLTNGETDTDTDLAAHLTITYHRGICIEGKAIKDVFPAIPKSDYLSPILADYRECLENISEDPIYCSLNLIRVFRYLKKGVISSKIEAGQWGLKTFPQELRNTIGKVVDCYQNGNDANTFTIAELVLLKHYVSDNVQKIIKQE